MRKAPPPFVLEPAHTLKEIMLEDGSICDELLHGEMELVGPVLSKSGFFRRPHKADEGLHQ